MKVQTPELYHLLYTPYCSDIPFCSNSRWFGTQREFTTSPDNCIVTGSSCSFVMIPHHSPSIRNILNHDDRSKSTTGRNNNNRSLTASGPYFVSPQRIYITFNTTQYISQYHLVVENALQKIEVYITIKMLGSLAILASRSFLGPFFPRLSLVPSGRFRRRGRQPL